MINGAAFKGENSFTHYVKAIAKRKSLFHYEMEYKRLNRYISFLEEEKEIVTKPFHYSAFCKYLLKNSTKEELGILPLYWILKQASYHQTDINGLKLLFQFSHLHNDSYYFMTLDESERVDIPFNFITVLICNYFYHHHLALKNYVDVAKKITDKDKIISNFEKSFISKKAS